jgi:uncharacterized membrane protein
MLTLLGIAVVVIGFAIRLNPLLVVAAAAIVTGLAAGMSPVAVISAFGKAFTQNRYLSVVWLVLPVIGLLERHGLQVRARALIAKLHQATAGRILLVYLIARQLTAAVGLISLGGHAQMVRPLIAPMAEGAGEVKHGPLTDRVRQRIRAYAASSDNIGVFFGEDIFIAFGSILLIKSTLASNGVDVSALQLSAWAIPTAALALLIHGTRLLLFDRWLARQPAATANDPDTELAP